MTLIKLLIILVVIHLACGFVQVSVNYFGGDMKRVDVREDRSAWEALYANTPLGQLIGGVDQEQDQPEDFLSNPPAILAFVNRIGDMQNGLLVLGYEFLNEMAPGTLPHMLVILTRVAFALLWFATGLATLRLIFESGLLHSKIGLFLVVGGGSIAAALSAVGAFLG